MSNDINQVTVGGRLTADVVLRFDKNGKPYAFFTVAQTDDYYWDKKDNKRTQFASCVIRGNDAKFLHDYHSKGSRVLIQGKLANTSQMVGGQKVNGMIVEVAYKGFHSVDTKVESRGGSNKVATANAPAAPVVAGTIVPTKAAGAVNSFETI